MLIKKLCHILTIKYQTASRKNEIDVHVLKQNDSQNVLISEKMHARYGTTCMVF